MVRRYVVKKYVGDKVLNDYYATRREALERYEILKWLGVDVLVMRNAL